MNLGYIVPIQRFLFTLDRVLEIRANASEFIANDPTLERLTMGLAREISRIRDNSGEYLTESCVLALQAFLAGYRIKDAGCFATLDELTRRFQGPSAADACTRAYLSFETSERALRAVLDTLSSLLTEKGDPASRVREGIDAGVSGAVLFRNLDLPTASVPSKCRPDRRRAIDSRAEGYGGVVVGSSTKRVVPSPSTLSTRIVPPSAVMMARAMYSPRPSPP